MSLVAVAHDLLSEDLCTALHCKQRGATTYHETNRVSYRKAIDSCDTGY